MSPDELKKSAANDVMDTPSPSDAPAQNQSNKIWHQAARRWNASWSKRQLQKFGNFMRGTWGYKVFKRMDEYKFFPKFMAARGGLTAMVMGGFMMTGLVISGISAMAITMAATGLGLAVFGAYGAITYGGNLLADGKRKFDQKVLKKEFQPKAAAQDENTPQQKAKKEKKIISPWERLGQTESWKKFNDLKMIKAVKSTKPYRVVEDLKIWSHLKNIGQDQEVRLRAFATTGSLAMVVATGAIFATQVIALPVLTISAASLFVLYMGANLAGGLFALGSHGVLFAKSVKTATKDSIRDHRRAKRAAKVGLDKIPAAIEQQGDKSKKKSLNKDFETVCAKASNDNPPKAKAPKTSPKKTPAKKAPKKGPTK